MENSNQFKKEPKDKESTLKSSRLTLQEYILIWEKICPEISKASKSPQQILEELLA